MLALLILFTLLQAFDAMTTYKIISNGGRELNQPLAWTFNKIGLVPGLLIYKGACAGIGWYIYTEESFMILALLTALYVERVRNFV